MGSTADFTRRANPSQINFLPYMFFICICPQQVRMDRLSRSFGSALSSHFCLVQISSTFISPRFDWSVSSECRSLNRLSQSKSVLSSHTRVIHKYVLPTVLQPTAVTTVTATCLKVLSARFTILNHKSGLVYHLLFRPRSLSVHPLVYKHLICLGLFLQGMQSLDVSVLSVWCLSALLVVVCLVVEVPQIEILSWASKSWWLVRSNWRRCFGNGTWY